VTDLTRTELWELVDDLEPESVELEIEALMDLRGLDRDEAELMVAAREAKEEEA
jgi:hypothetical protein